MSNILPDPPSNCIHIVIERPDTSESDLLSQLIADQRPRSRSTIFVPPYPYHFHHFRVDIDTGLLLQRITLLKSNQQRKGDITSPHWRNVRPLFSFLSGHPQIQCLIGYKRVVSGILKALPP